MALTVTLLSGRGYAMDTLLGVLAHSSLAFGLVAVSFLSGVRIDLMAYLFGDILAVSRTDLLVIWGGAGVVVALMAWRWTPLLMATLSEELAFAYGLNPRREQFIPAASARGLARTPEAMALIAAAIGAFSAVAGLRGAYILDTPAGPSIVCVAAICFAVFGLLSWRSGKAASPRGF